jgi:hypothetical protein
VLATVVVKYYVTLGDLANQVVAPKRTAPLVQGWSVQVEPKILTPVAHLQPENLGGIASPPPIDLDASFGCEKISRGLSHDRGNIDGT